MLANWKIWLTLGGKAAKTKDSSLIWEPPNSYFNWKRRSLKNPHQIDKMQGTCVLIHCASWKNEYENCCVFLATMAPGRFVKHTRPAQRVSNTVQLSMLFYLAVPGWLAEHSPEQWGTFCGNRPELLRAVQKTHGGDKSDKHSNMTAK